MPPPRRVAAAGASGSQPWAPSHSMSAVERVPSASRAARSITRPPARSLRARRSTTVRSSSSSVGTAVVSMSDMCALTLAAGLEATGGVEVGGGEHDQGGVVLEGVDDVLAHGVLDRPHRARGGGPGCLERRLVHAAHAELPAVAGGAVEDAVGQQQQALAGGDAPLLDLDAVGHAAIA